MVFRDSELIILPLQWHQSRPFEEGDAALRNLVNRADDNTAPPVAIVVLERIAMATAGEQGAPQAIGVVQMFG